MSRQYVNTVADGDTLDEIYLLAEKQLRANRNGDLYLLAQLRDKTGQISGLMWNVDEAAMSQLEAGGYAKVRGKVQLYQGNLQSILTAIEPVPDTTLDREEFIPVTGADTAKLLERLQEILRGIENVHFKALMECFLDDEAIVDGLSKAPAGVKLHHAFTGGLLEHIVNLLETALRIDDLYPTVDGELLLVGIFLHDLGKLRELEYDTTFLYTDEGQLIGHLIIGVEMFNEKLPLAEQRSGEVFPDELKWRIKHMIVSHHGSYEFGSPKLPMTPEAIALHHLDNLDAKVNEFTNMIDSDPNAQSNWTPYANTMQRKIYKGVRETT